MFVGKSSNAVLSKCTICPAHMHGPCQNAGWKAIETLAGVSQTCSYEKDATIIHQGADLGQVGIIISGIVKLTNIGMDGRHTVVALLEKGSLIGSLTGSSSRFAYEAASPVAICTMPQLAFKRILKAHPEVACRVLELSMKRSEEVQEWLTLFNCRTTQQRLAGYLHALALSQLPIAISEEAFPLEIPIGRKDLAAYLGTTPETLSRNFRRLAGMGILSITDGSHVTIQNVRKLRRAAGLSGEELQSLSQTPRKETEMFRGTEDCAYVPIH